MNRRFIREYPTYPLVGIVAILLGLTASLNFFPYGNYREPGALSLSGLCLSLGLLVPVIWAVLRSPTAVLRTEHILMFGLTYWVLLDAVQGAYWLLPGSRLGARRLIVGIAVFACFIWVGSYIQSRRPPTVTSAFKNTDLGVAFLFYAGVLSFFIGTMKYYVSCNLSVMCIYESFYLPRFEAPWRNLDGPFGTVMIHIRYAAFLTAPLAVALYAVERRFSWRVFLVSFLASLFILLLVRDGGRRVVGTVLGATMLMWLLIQPRIRWRHLFKLFFMAVLLLLLMQTMLVSRNEGIANVDGGGFSLDAPNRTGIAVDRNFVFASRLMTVVPTSVPHSGMSGLTWMLTMPIPRSVFPYRPEDRGIGMAELTGRERAGRFSWTASVIGDLWLIGGWPALVLGGFLFGYLASYVSGLLTGQKDLRKMLLYALGTMALFVGFRALHNIVLIAFSLLALSGFLWLRSLVLVPAASGRRFRTLSHKETGPEQGKGAQACE